MSIIFLDIETIGLPNKINGQYSSYKNLNAYDTARIVQIAIIESNKSGKIISKHDWIINPNINRAKIIEKFILSISIHQRLKTLRLRRSKTP